MSDFSRPGQFICGLLLTLCSAVAHAGEMPQFEHLTLEENIGKVCYAVTVADVNNDGKPDPVALSENRLIWYENPSWKPHVILEDQLDPDHVCLAPHDIDGDGLIDFAIGAGWTKKGTINWVSRDSENPDGLWKTYLIGEEVWTHRMRWANMFGDDQLELTVSPLNKTSGEGVRLLAFEIPENPQRDRWPATVLDHSLNRMHNHWVIGSGSQKPSRHKLLTASQEGVHIISASEDEQDAEKFGIKSPVDGGRQGETATESGAGEIKNGHVVLSDKAVGFYTTIEPMHGQEVVVYEMNRPKTPLRFVLDDTLNRGHALWVAEIDHKADAKEQLQQNQEIIVGHSEPASGEIKGPGIYIYRWKADSKDLGQWEKHILDDGGIATEDLIAHDFNGDGWIDILAGGRNTHNVKLYLNQGHPGE